MHHPPIRKHHIHRHNRIQRQPPRPRDIPIPPMAKVPSHSNIPNRPMRHRAPSQPKKLTRESPQPHPRTDHSYIRPRRRVQRHSRKAVLQVHNQAAVPAPRAIRAVAVAAAARLDFEAVRARYGEGGGDGGGRGGEDDGGGLVGEGAVVGAGVGGEIGGGGEEGGDRKGGEVGADAGEVGVWGMGRHFDGEVCNGGELLDR